MAEIKDACSSSANEELNVLQKYLSLFSNDTVNPLDLLAANCVIDWFGVSVRSEKKISEFLKYEIKTQLKHADFNHVERCNSIEFKPLHMGTKLIPKNKSPKQQQICNLSKSNSHAVSDTEDDIELPKSTTAIDNSMEVSCTPPNSLNSDMSLDMTPLVPEPEEISSNEEVDSNWLHKRVKRRISQESFKRLKTINNDSDEQIEEKRSEPATTNFSTDLQYVEAKGRLLALNPSKYDKDVRLRISYRKHLTDDTVQFALIIYERLQPNGEVYEIQRKKLNFNDVEDEDVGTVDNEHIITPINASIATNIDEETSNYKEFAALRTPTKVSSTPPATPRRRRRDVATSNLKRIYAAGSNMSSVNPETPRTSAKKCNAARTLRL